MAGNPKDIPRSQLLEDGDRFTSPYRVMKNAYRIGSLAIKMCSWSRLEGYQRESPPLAYDPDTSPHTFEPGIPIVRITGEIRGRDVTVSMICRTCVFTGVYTTDKSVSGKTYYDEVYADDGYHTLTMTIPAGTRETVLLFRDFGRLVWDISEIVVANSSAGDAFDIFVMQGNNCKLMYGWNWDDLLGKLEDVGFSRFASLRRCNTCEGSGESNYLDGETATCPFCGGAGNLLGVDGVWIDVECWNCSGRGTVCPTCTGSGLYGQNAKLDALYRIGERFGIFRKTSSETDELLRRRVCTRVWWITPNDAEIVRFFAKIADVTEPYVKLVKREDEHEPCWYMFMPTFSGPHAFFPYGTFDALEYVEFAESVTPLGVNYIVGWWDSVGRRCPEDIGLTITDRGSRKVVRDVLGAYIDHFHFNNADLCDYREEVFVVAGEDPVGVKQRMWFDFDLVEDLTDWTVLAGNADWVRDNLVSTVGNWSLRCISTADDTLYRSSVETRRGRICGFFRAEQVNVAGGIYGLLGTTVPFVGCDQIVGVDFDNDGIVKYQNNTGFFTNMTYNNGIGIVNFEYEAGRWYKVEIKWDVDANRQWIRVSDRIDPNKVSVVSRALIWQVGLPGGNYSGVSLQANNGGTFYFDRISLSSMSSPSYEFECGY